MKALFFSLLKKQFTRYAFVGGLSFLVDFACLYALTEYLGIHYLISASLSFCLGLTANYLLCLAWVFDFRRTLPNPWHEFMVFSAIGLTALLLNNLLLWLLTEYAGIHYLLSKIAATAAILFFNFSLRRWLLFSPPRAATLKTTP